MFFFSSQKIRKVYYNFEISAVLRRRHYFIFHFGHVFCVSPQYVYHIVYDTVISNTDYVNFLSRFYLKGLGILLTIMIRMIWF